MKKKVLFGIAASALAAVMCVGFVGCGGGNAQSVKGEEVTAEEWVAAFSESSFENFKLVAAMKMEQKAGEESGKQEISATIIVADKKEHIVMTTKSEGTLADSSDEVNEEVYVDKTGASSVYFEKNDEGQWETDTSGTSASDILTSITIYSLLYSAFKYDDEKAGYVVNTDNALLAGVPEQVRGAVLKFKDAKLVGMYMEYEEGDKDNGEYMKVSYDYFFTYGGQSVTLPTVNEA